MSPDDLSYLGLIDLSHQLRRRALSPVEVTQTLLARIERLDPSLHAYAVVTPEHALRQARTAEAEIARGIDRGPLHGVPIAVKDLCDTRGIPTAGGMKFNAGRIPVDDATVVTKLADAGAVLLGKLQCTEGASANHHPDTVAPVNPWQPEAWTGVSSSGSGVATAAGLCFAAIGTDTAGSIRFPSAMNGLTGVKPTYGRVSRHGVMPLAESMDHVGPMARSAADAAAMLQVIAGTDPHDPTTLRAPVPDHRVDIENGVRGLRVGIDPRFNTDGIDAGVAQVASDAAVTLAGLGATVREVRFPDVDDLLRAWWPLCAAQAAVAHSSDFPDHAAGYGPRFRRMIEFGQQVSGTDIVRTAYLRARLCGQMLSLWEQIDLLVMPAMHITAPSVSRMSQRMDTETTLRMIRFTAPFNLTGNPTITLCGGAAPDGVPLGFQLAAADLAEPLLLRAAHAYQAATSWHVRHPPI